MVLAWQAPLYSPAMSGLRRLFSSAPLPTGEGLGLILAGIAGWSLAIAQTRPDWAPEWAGWAIVGLSILAISRGVVGIAASAGAGLRSLRGPTGWPGNRAPRTEEENTEVVERRPFGWEYLYFAGVLWVERERLNVAYYDHELHYARPTGETLPSDLDTIKAFIHDRMEEAQAILASLVSVMGSDAQERAFGEDGVEGDPGRIHQLAVRWNTAYADFLEWAARLRGTGKPEPYRNVFEAIARMADAPIDQYRDFVTAFVAAADGIPAAGKRNTPLAIELALRLEIDPEAMRVFDAELARLQEALDRENEGEDYKPPPMTMTQVDEREGIIRDARRHRDTFKLMGRLNGIWNTALDVQADYRERVTELEARRDSYAVKYGPLPNAPDAAVDMQGPNWLREIVNDLHRLVMQMGQN